MKVVREGNHMTKEVRGCRKHPPGLASRCPSFAPVQRDTTRSNPSFTSVFFLTSTAIGLSSLVLFSPLPSPSQAHPNSPRLMSASSSATTASSPGSSSTPLQTISHRSSPTSRCVSSRYSLALLSSPFSPRSSLSARQQHPNSSPSHRRTSPEADRTSLSLP
jgi:hypothetical protein